MNKIFFPLILILALAPSGYCFDIVYPLAGQKYKPVTKGSLFIELASETAKKDIGPVVTGFVIEDVDIEVSTIELNAAYDISNILSLNIKLPYVKNKMKEGSETIESSGIGDISFGLKALLIDDKRSFADGFFLLTADTATGKSPYEIDPSKERSTGSGGYSIKPELGLSKQLNGSLFYASMFYQYNRKITGLKYHQYATDGEAGVHLQSVDPGDEFGGSIGWVGLVHNNFSWMQAYHFHRVMKSEYDWQGRDDYKGETEDYSTVSTGFGFQYPGKTALFTSVSFGVGEEAPDYVLKFSIAF